VPFELSMGEILVILFVALLVFGGKLPETARKFGLAFSEFKRGMREEFRKVENGLRNDRPTEPPPPPAAPPEAKEPAETPAPPATPPQAKEPAEPEPTRRDP
jgi:sec-independent protein translocase protein TatA